MLFALKVMDSSRKVVALELEAADEPAVRALAHERGYSVLALSRRGIPLAFRRKAPFPVTLFSIELLALLDAGLNVVEALHALEEKEPSTEHRRVLAGLLDALHKGQSLSQAAAAFPHVFGALYVATIRSSERTGGLKDALSRYVAYQEEIDKVRKKVVAALLYPAILSVVGTLVIAFLLFYVVPRFARVYEDMSTDLPAFSSALLAVGRWMEHNGILALALVLAALAMAAYALRQESVRARLVERLWRTPGIGHRMRLYQLARFYRTVGMLLLAGVPMVKAFEMVSGLLAPNLKAQLDRAVILLREGSAPSAALASTGLATPIATRMMLVGERSGQMGELMERSARFCDDENARFVDAFTRIFEPVLMAVLGLAVGAVVVLMYMPVFELAGSLR